MQNISGFGTSLTIIATQSFPFGFGVTKFADDVAPITHKEVEPTAYQELIDGSLFFFTQAAPVEVAISVIPGSEDDINLKILLQAQKGGIQLLPVPDVTSMVLSYPKGKVMLTNGSIIRGPLMDSIGDTSRKNSNTYTFVFGNFAGAQNSLEAAVTIGREILSLF